jgi:hypothetical protein
VVNFNRGKWSVCSGLPWSISPESPVTGHKNALENLFDVLPDVILECSGGKYKIKDKEKLKDFFNTAYKQ